MSRVIRIPESTYQRIQKLAVPFEDTPSSIIDKVLDHYESGADSKAEANKKMIEHVAQKNLNHSHVKKGIRSRYPRQRGVTVNLNNHELTAESVRDLYGQVLEFLAENQHLVTLEPHLPIRTSSKRYLIARQPIHPNGNHFVMPVEYQGYFMESHKSYDNALKHLWKIFNICDISFSYVR